MMTRLLPWHGGGRVLNIWTIRLNYNFWDFIRRFSDKKYYYIIYNNIELSHWYKVDKVFYTPEVKLRCVKITSYITKRS